MGSRRLNDLRAASLASALVGFCLGHFAGASSLTDCLDVQFADLRTLYSLVRAPS